MVSINCPTIEIVKIGKGSVCNGISLMLTTQVPGRGCTFCALEIGTTMKFYYFSDDEQEEPCEGRLSSTVLWEGRGEILLPDPIIANGRKTPERKNLKNE